MSSSGSQSPAPAARVRHVTVTPEQSGQRLDNFLIRELKGLPKSRVYRLVRKGEVRVNRGRVDARYRLQSGDSVRIPPVRLGASAAVRVPADLQTGPVLYEDAHLLVLDKPAGVPVHGGTGVSAGVIEALRERRPEQAFLELVHRLDRDTSGCLMLAKSRAALTALHAALRRDPGGQTITKRYAALVRGRPGQRRITVSAALQRNTVRGGERMVTVAEEGERAESVFLLQRAGEVCSEVEIELVTGRTHQARVHAAHIGHPIAGDRKYGDRDFNKRARAAGLKRLALHARSLSFAHPVTGERCDVSAAVPEIFATVLEKLNA
ncbi:MAG TPA: RluA family pseudouridine synthase [Arenicellales bacterium]|nr:RluA family pseudouridine synthase [Arenicellales bacterium]